MAPPPAHHAASSLALSLALGPGQGTGALGSQQRRLQLSDPPTGSLQLLTIIPLLLLLLLLLSLLWRLLQVPEGEGRGGSGIQGGLDGVEERAEGGQRQTILGIFLLKIC